MKGWGRGGRHELFSKDFLRYLSVSQLPSGGSKKKAAERKAEEMPSSPKSGKIFDIISRAFVGAKNDGKIFESKICLFTYATILIL